MLKEYLKKRIGIFAFGVFLVLVFWSSAELQDGYDRLIAFIDGYASQQPLLSVLVFLLLTVLSVLLLFFSSVFMVPVAVSLWGPFNSTLLLLAGWLAGAVVSYAIGRFLGLPVLRQFISETKLDYYQKMLSQHAGLMPIFLARFTLPSEIPGYVLGASRFNFTKYMWITLLAEIPYAIVTVYAFDAILRGDPFTLGSIVAVWLLAFTLLVRLVYNKVQRAKRK